MPSLRPHPPRAPGAPHRPRTRCCWRAPARRPTRAGAAPALARGRGPRGGLGCVPRAGGAQPAAPPGPPLPGGAGGRAGDRSVRLRAAFAANARQALPLAGELRRLMDALDGGGRPRAGVQGAGAGRPRLRAPGAAHVQRPGPARGAGGRARRGAGAARRTATRPPTLFARAGRGVPARGRRLPVSSSPRPARWWSCTAAYRPRASWRHLPTAG